MLIPLCPVCRSRMLAARSAPVGTWQCAECAGIWLSSSAVTALASGGGNQRSLPATNAVSTSHPKLGKLICPDCFEPTLVPVGENPVEARSCPRCHGLFVVAKEKLVAIAPHLAIEDLPITQNETADAIAGAIGREIAMTIASVVVACWLP
jgi:Zn-finger nucleic acid-binding protein